MPVEVKKMAAMKDKITW